MIHDDLREQLKESMKARTEVRTRVIRALLTAFTNELVAQRKKPDETLPDDDALSVVKRQVKQRKDSIEQFEKGNRDDLAAIEKEELLILDVYMPEQVSEDDIRKAVKDKIAELGISEKKDMGRLIGAVMSALSGGADGQVVKKIVDEELA